MSNGINAPYGLQVVNNAVGNGGTQKLTAYRIKVAANGVTTTPALYSGDPVKFKTEGALNSYLLGDIVPALIPQVVGVSLVTPGLFLGVFASCRYKPAGSESYIESSIWPGAVTVEVGSEVIMYVNDDPMAIFKVQISTSTDNSTIVDTVAHSVFRNWMIGQNAKLQLGGVVFTAPVGDIPTQNPRTGNTRSGLSGVYLDGSSPSLANAGAGNPDFDVKIIGLAPSSFTNGPASLTAGDKAAGVDLPFVDLLVKFNKHVFGSTGTPGPFNAA